MTRHHTLLCTLTVLLLIVGLMIVSVEHCANQEVAYSVTVLTNQLTHHPRAWVGRTVLVHGVAWVTVSHTERRGCGESPFCIIVRPTWSLGDPEKLGPAVNLPLQWGAPDPLRALLRQVPLVALLAPPQQVAEPGTIATYRIQLRALPHSATDYEAVLLDAAR